MKPLGGVQVPPQFLIMLWAELHAWLKETGAKIPRP
jgi:hypothetical protein